MKFIVVPALFLAMALTTAPSATAGEVVVKKAHVCCGACVRAVTQCLKDMEGVSGAAADVNTRTISFKADDDKAAEKGIAALAKAGFHGKAAHGDKELSFPQPKIKEGQAADTVTFTGVHLCCGACVRGAKEALEDVKNVNMIDVDTKTKTVKMTGKKIDLKEAISAFNAGGFHGNLKK